MCINYQKELYIIAFCVTFDDFRKKIYRRNCKKISSDRKYANRIFTDYDFARSEFLNTGLKIEKSTHKQMMAGYKALITSTSKIFRRGRAGSIIEY